MGKSLVIPFLARALTISWGIPRLDIARPSEEEEEDEDEDKVSSSYEISAVAANPAACVRTAEALTSTHREAWKLLLKTPTVGLMKIWDLIGIAIDDEGRRSRSELQEARAANLVEVDEALKKIVFIIMSVGEREGTLNPKMWRVLQHTSWTLILYTTP